MTEGSSIVNTLHHLRIAKEYAQNVIRGSKGDLGGKLFAKYDKKIDWIIRDFITFPAFTKEVVEGLREELKSDPLLVDDLGKSTAILNPANREIVHDLVERLLKEQIAGQ